MMSQRKNNNNEMMYVFVCSWRGSIRSIDSNCSFILSLKFLRQESRVKRSKQMNRSELLSYELYRYETTVPAFGMPVGPLALEMRYSARGDSILGSWSLGYFE
jgi:hypothetical protein